MAISPKASEQAAVDSLIRNISGDDPAWYRNTAPTLNKDGSPVNSGVRETSMGLPQLRETKKPFMLRGEQAKADVGHHKPHHGHHKAATGHIQRHKTHRFPVIGGL